MVTVGLLGRLEAKTGKELDVESFLRKALALVDEEPATTTWYAIRIGPSTFGIFDTFADEAGRQAHLSGEVAGGPVGNAGPLFAQAPVIHEDDIFSAHNSGF